MKVQFNPIRDIGTEYENIRFQANRAARSKDPLRDMQVIKGIVFSATRTALLISSIALGVFAVATIPAMIAGAAVSSFVGLTAGATVLHVAYKVLAEKDPTKNTMNNAAKSLWKDTRKYF